MRVLVTGGRDYDDQQAVFQALDKIAGATDADPIGRIAVTIIHGGATGADRLADRWAAAMWRNVEAFPANWTAYGRAAGPIRNQEMIDRGRPDLVVAFPGGRGTADMIRRAKAAGIKVVEVGNG